jgi:sterol desaturase/sphingolipid hydroxylase (fatty acid hydroxylase superfamily)
MNIDIVWFTFVAIAASACVLIFLEWRYPYAKGQRLFRKGFYVDFVWYAILQSYILSLVIYAIIGLVQPHVDPEDVGVFRSLPLLAQLGIAILVHDFYIYWFHRLQHAVPFLWRIHEAHHSSHDVDWLSGSRSHPTEILINQTVEFLPLVIFASPEVVLLKGFVDAVWGMYIHANINVSSGWLQYVVNGPEMHRWHHADDEHVTNKNFSTKLAIWDWMFGTAYLPRHRKPERYGIGGEEYPESYFQQTVYAFRAEQRDN